MTGPKMLTSTTTSQTFASSFGPGGAARALETTRREKRGISGTKEEGGKET